RVTDIKHPFTNLLFHQAFTLISHNYDAPIGLIAIRPTKFLHDGENLIIPAQDNRMTILDHPGATLTECFKATLKSTANNADQCTDNKNAPQSYKKHQQAKPPSLIPTHGSSVKCTHKAHPKSLTHNRNILTGR